MVNRSSTGRAAPMFLLLVAIFLPVMASATAHFSSLRSVGMLTSPTFNKVAVNENPAEKVSFFGTLGPDASAKGAVKTFTIKIVSRQKSNSGKASLGTAELSEPGTRSFLRPVAGRVSSMFGRRKHPKSHVWHFHSGVDIVAPKGTPIASSQGGKVTYAGWRRGYGLLVVVDHGNNLETAYAHCSKVTVKVGQSVNAGQRIAYVGNTGVTTGSHLHFEVRRNGSVQNPFRFLKKL